MELAERRSAVAVVAAAAVVLALAGVAGAGTAKSQRRAATVSATKLGVYRGAAASGKVGSYATWLGKPVSWALDFFAHSTWTDIETPSWWLDGWKGSGYRVVYSVPLLPDSDGTVAAGAAGAYDGHFVKLAKNLVASGQGDAVLRLGWEFNGNWYRWSAAPDPAAFAAYWRHIVRAMRGVPGASFQFDWCPTLGTASVAPDKAYPGNAYVDTIGLDVYDQGWGQGWQDPVLRWQSLLTQPYGLKWQRRFAAAHGKPVSFPEWGVANRVDGHGGGDDPYFIDKMHTWLAGSNLAYALYFEFDAPDGSHRLMTGAFPQSAARFRALFGAS